MKKIAVVFPGQGSQSVGMFSAIANQFSEIQETFSEASSVLGYDLWQLVQQGPASELDKTVHTQPALLTASYAVWRIMMRHGKVIQPSWLAGHSLGEYTALLCAGAFSLKEAVHLVAARGQYMQEAVPVGTGALAAIIGLDDAIVSEICAACVEKNEVLTPANFNCPGQVVIAGNLAAVQRALILAKEKGSRLATLLPVSVPSHCALMKPAADRLAKLLATLDIQTPNLPVVNNVEVAVYKNAEQIRQGLTEQLYKPVRWSEIIQLFSQQGVTDIIECGPGKVLCGLNKRILPSASLMSTNDLIAI